MMNGMMDGGAMMWDMGLIWLLIILVLVLGAAALVKYLFFDKRRVTWDWHRLCSVACGACNAPSEA